MSSAQSVESLTLFIRCAGIADLFSAGTGIEALLRGIVRLYKLYITRRAEIDLARSMPISQRRNLLRLCLRMLRGGILQKFPHGL